VRLGHRARKSLTFILPLLGPAWGFWHKQQQQQQQQYLFAIGGWKPEGHKSIKAGSKKK